MSSQSSTRAATPEPSQLATKMAVDLEQLVSAVATKVVNVHDGAPHPIQFGNYIYAVELIYIYLGASGTLVQSLRCALLGPTKHTISHKNNDKQRQVCGGDKPSKYGC